VEFGLIGAAGTASQAARPKNGSAPGGAGSDAIALASFGAVVDALAGGETDDGSTGEDIDLPDACLSSGAGPLSHTDAAEDAARRLAQIAVGVELPLLAAAPPLPVATPEGEPTPLLAEPAIGIPAGEHPIEAPLDLPLRPALPISPDAPEIPDLDDRWKDQPPVLDLPLRQPQLGEGERSALQDQAAIDKTGRDDNTSLKQALAQADRAMSFRAALKLGVTTGSIAAGDGAAAAPSSLNRSIAELITRAFSGPAAKGESAAAVTTSLIGTSVIAPNAAAIVSHALGTGFSATLASQALAPAPADVSPGSAAMQIVQAVRMQWSRGVGEAQITLEPQHFGQVSVSLRVEDGQVVARLQAEAPVVREWLQANQASLRQSLADQHLTLHRLEITEPSGEARHDERRGSGSGEPRERQAPRRSRRDDTGETFDVVV